MVVLHEWTALPNRTPHRGVLFFLWGKARKRPTASRSAIAVGRWQVRTARTGFSPLAWRNLEIVV